jgi:hypothetical protein
LIAIDGGRARSLEDRVAALKAGGNKEQRLFRNKKAGGKPEPVSRTSPASALGPSAPAGKVEG